MKLTYWDANPPNFGDALNATMWDHLLPRGFLDEDDAELFLGIGSILWDYLPLAPRKVVAGSGYAGYTKKPLIHDGSWDVLWVRGPRTARSLDLDPGLAITDSAVLLRRTPLPEPRAGVGAAFMPHVDSIERGDWEEVCRLAGVTFLDPRAPVGDLVAQIRGATVVVTEAMHGAIVSDALRTPWIGVLPMHWVHRDKWRDWSESLAIDLRPHRLAGSNATEVYAAATGLAGQGRRSRAVLAGGHMRPVNALLRHRAARALLRTIERVEPQLSRDAVMEEMTTRCEEALAHFVASREVRRPLQATA